MATINKNNKNHYYYLDVLNIIAIIFVLFLHSSELAFSYFPESHRWLLSVIMQCVFIPAVPIFFMISGSNIISYHERYTTRTFFKKRFVKTGIPFLAWSIIWYAFHYYSKIRPLTNRSLIDGILTNQIQNIFWFFYSIFGLYLITPILSLITTRENKRIVEYMIFGCFLFTGVFQYYYQVIGKSLPIIFSSVPFFTGASVGFFLIGWYLKEFSLKGIENSFLYVIGLMALAIMIVLTLFISKQQGHSARAVYSAFGLPAILYSVATYQFVIDKLKNWHPRRYIKLIVRQMASLSLGVYCVHEFFIYYAEDVMRIPLYSYYHLIILPIVSYILSAIFVYCLKKVPLLRKIFP